MFCEVSWWYGPLATSYVSKFANDMCLPKRLADLVELTTTQIM